MTRGFNHVRPGCILPALSRALTSVNCIRCYVPNKNVRTGDCGVRKKKEQRAGVEQLDPPRAYGLAWPARSPYKYRWREVTPPSVGAKEEPVPCSFFAALRKGHSCVILA